MNPERIAELRALRSRDDEERPWRTMMVEDIDDLLATAEREAKLREASEEAAWLLSQCANTEFERGETTAARKLEDCADRLRAALEKKGGE